MSDTELSQNTEWADSLNRITRRTLPIKVLAEDADVKATTIYKIRDGEHDPRWSEARKLLRALPNTAVNDIFRPLGFAVQALEGNRCDHTTLAALCRTAAEFADALEDGRIDHLEYGKMRPFVEGVRNLADAWLAEQNPVAKQVQHLGIIK